MLLIDYCQKIREFSIINLLKNKYVYSKLHFYDTVNAEKVEHFDKKNGHRFKNVRHYKNMKDTINQMEYYLKSFLIVLKIILLNFNS